MTAPQVPTSSDARDPIALCLTAFHQGRFDEADIQAQLALEQWPNSGLIWQVRGLIHRRRSEFVAAREALETAMSLVPLGPAGRCALADSYVALGQHDLARTLYGDLADDPQCPTGLLAPVAAGLGNVGQPAEALKVCRILIHRDPDRHDALFGIAYYLRCLGHPVAEVIPPIQRAHQLAPDSLLYRVTLALLLGQEDRHDEAEPLLDGLDPERLGCCHCLRRIATIFPRWAAPTPSRNPNSPVEDH